GKQTQAERCGNVSPRGCLCYLIRIECRTVRQEWDAQEPGARPDFIPSEARRSQHKVRQSERRAAKALYVIGHDRHVSRYSRPDPGGFRGSLQFVKIQLTRLNNGGGIDDVAYTEVKVAVHAL